MNEQLRIALIAGALGVLGTLLGVIAQAIIVSNTERRRRQEETRLLLREERRQVYAKFLLSSPITQLLPQVFSDIFIEQQARHARNDPPTDDVGQVVRTSIANAWNIRVLPTYFQYVEQSMAACLVATDKVLEAIGHENATVNEFFEFDEQIREELIQSAEGADDADYATSRYATLVERFGREREAVTAAMREELGYSPEQATAAPRSRLAP